MTDLEKYYAAKEAYYNGEPIMTDLEFDELEKKLGLENKSFVGARHNPSYTVKHPIIMGSLSKVQIKEDENGNVDWPKYWSEIASYVNHYNAFGNDDVKVVISPKYDGCSFEVVLDSKKNIVSISSRGDGEYGKDLSQHLRSKVESSAEQIGNYFDSFDSCILRGEVLIRKNVFEMRWSNFVNPRSFVSGVLNRDYDANDKEFLEMLNDIEVVIYDIRTENNGVWKDLDWHSYSYDACPRYVIPCIINGSDFEKIYKTLETYRSECEYALDGFVIKPQEKFRANNTTLPRPKDCVAVKYIPMLEETVVEEIIWSTRKTNELIPVIKVRPVIMDGKEVSRASAHNYGYLIDNKISVGTKLILSLAGDIIPFIYKVTDTSGYDENKLCLSTVENTYIDGCHLYKQLSKEEVTKKRFLNSCSALNIPGMGPAAAEKLFESLSSNPIEEYADFFSVEDKPTPDNILLVNPIDIEMGIGGKTGSSIRKVIEKIFKTLTLKDIILTLCIEDCGPKITAQIEKQLLTQNGDFSHMPEKSYKWVFDSSSEEYERMMAIVSGFNKTLDDYKEIFIETSNKTSEQIPVILTGEPNNYVSKGEFLKCNPQYRLTGSWKEVKIVFTNDLSSNTGKMKNARAKGIEIQLY